MSAARYSLNIEQGATFSLTLTVTLPGSPALTGYTARMQVRALFTSDTPLLDLTVENGGVEIDADARTITLLASAETTAALVPTNTAVYDVEMEDSDGIVTRLLAGKARILPEVTR